MTITVQEEIAKYLSAMEEVVEEFGADHVYERPEGAMSLCVYVFNNEPSCLIAKVLYKLGVSTEVLAKLDRECGSICNLDGHSELKSAVGIVHTETTWVLQAAQSTQDTNGTWGDALSTAREKATHYNNN